MVTKNDTGVEIYPKSIEHGFEARVYGRTRENSSWVGSAVPQ